MDMQIVVGRATNDAVNICAVKTTKQQGHDSWERHRAAAADDDGLMMLR